MQHRVNDPVRSSKTSCDNFLLFLLNQSVLSGLIESSSEKSLRCIPHEASRHTGGRLVNLHILQPEVGLHL